MGDIAYIEAAVGIVVALGGVAVGYGILQQKVAGLRRDVERVERGLDALKDNQSDHNKTLYTELRDISRNVHLIMGKLNIDSR